MIKAFEVQPAGSHQGEDGLLFDGIGVGETLVFGSGAIEVSLIFEHACDFEPSSGGEFVATRGSVGFEIAPSSVSVLRFEMSLAELRGDCVAAGRQNGNARKKACVAVR